MEIRSTSSRYAPVNELGVVYLFGVLHETFDFRIELKLRHLRVLMEGEDSVVEALLRENSELAEVYEVDRFLCDTTNAGMMILYR